MHIAKSHFNHNGLPSNSPLTINISSSIWTANQVHYYVTSMSLWSGQKVLVHYEITRFVKVALL